MINHCSRETIPCSYYLLLNLGINAVECYLCSWSSRDLWNMTSICYPGNFSLDYGIRLECDTGCEMNFLYDRDGKFKQYIWGSFNWKMYWSKLTMLSETDLLVKRYLLWSHNKFELLHHSCYVIFFFSFIFWQLFMFLSRFPKAFLP